MTATKLAEMKRFSGELSLDAEQISVGVSVGLNASGALEFAFEPILLTETSKFLLLKWHDDKREVVYFTLRAKAENGASFETDRLHFTSVNRGRDSAGAHIVPVAACEQATLRYGLKEPAAHPALRMRMKGFENLGSLHEDCPLGHVAVRGQAEIEDFNTVTGSIAVQAVEAVENIDEWRAEAQKLLEHIRRVMSLAASSFLRAPVMEFFHGDRLEVTVSSQTRQHAPTMRIVHFLAQEPVLKAAIRSFFAPPLDVKRLFFAIEWFAMEATYNEMRLVNAMTALENLIDSNATIAEALILPRAQFDRIRRVLLSVIRACLGKWAADKAADASLELNEKLSELNRRSLLRKLDLLAARWKVPLDGITTESLKAAKQARDKVVHRGQYYEDAKATDADLWTHVTVAREVAVRFLFTAIGYEGQYISLMGGYHQAHFPPLGST